MYWCRLTLDKYSGNGNKRQAHGRQVMTRRVIARFRALLFGKIQRKAMQAVSAYYTQLFRPDFTSYSANAPTTPAITIAPMFLATFATAAPVETATEAVGVAWYVTVALGITLLDRTATLVDDIKLDGTVMLFVGVRTVAL
jgi:hypothetical protein